jgi:hypothetical protein
VPAAVACRHFANCVLVSHAPANIVMPAHRIWSAMNCWIGCFCADRGACSFGFISRIPLLPLGGGAFLFAMVNLLNSQHQCSVLDVSVVHETGIKP